LSQHGGRSSTGGETVLPRQNRLFPVWCLPCAVKLPTRVAGRAPTQPELRRLLPRPPSRTQRAAGGVGFFLDPPATSLFFSRLPGRPSVRHSGVTETAGRFALFPPAPAQPLSAETHHEVVPSRTFFTFQGSEPKRLGVTHTCMAGLDPRSA